jgi:hypothetical protein
MLAQKLPAAQAFKVPDKPADMLRDDLKDAKIDYIVDGKVFDFHSLRHETGTLLAASGVDVKTAQTLMRHSDVNLTMSIYTHTLRGAESKAIAKLPDLTTGTDSPSFIALTLSVHRILFATFWEYQFRLDDDMES